ncbi:rod-binding protein, partial [Salmonella enterica subsp. enterica serovar Anatum]|nr:rod-binding protein [Salmonella enterica subsp. enterica serovar Anatum]
DQTRLYTSMYDQQIAQQMTAGKGLGLADMMVKQMTGGQTMPADDAPQVPLKFSLETVNSYQNQALTQLVRKAIPKTPDSSDAPL